MGNGTTCVHVLFSIGEYSPFFTAGIRVADMGLYWIQGYRTDKEHIVVRGKPLAQETGDRD